MPGVMTHDVRERSSPGAIVTRVSGRASNGATRNASSGNGSAWSSATSYSMRVTIGAPGKSCPNGSNRSHRTVIGPNVVSGVEPTPQDNTFSSSRPKRFMVPLGSDRSALASRTSWTHSWAAGTVSRVAARTVVAASSIAPCSAAAREARMATAAASDSRKARQHRPQEPFRRGDLRLAARRGRGLPEVDPGLPRFPDPALGVRRHAGVEQRALARAQGDRVRLFQQYAELALDRRQAVGDTVLTGAQLTKQLPDDAAEVAVPRLAPRRPSRPRTCRPAPESSSSVPPPHWT